MLISNTNMDTGVYIRGAARLSDYVRQTTLRGIVTLL